MGGPGDEAAAPLSAGPVLRDRIVAHLLHGPDSISGIARALSHGRARPLHRLHVAGYLHALAEAGVVREGERPPSKLYRLASPEPHLSLHQRVGRAVRETEPDPTRHAALVVAVLERVLGRPVFRAELLHAGAAGGGGGPAGAAGLLAVARDERERRAYRALLQRRPLPRIEVPRGDPLYVPADRADTAEAAQALVLRVLREATGSEHLAAQGAPRHVALTLDGAPA